MKILVVDDNTTNRKLLRVHLEAENHTVLETTDGVEALRLLEGEPVDAVISDILMPNMDGFRFCLEIRKQPKLSAMPFVFYTSTYDSPTDRQLAQTVGADRYIVKPAPVATILEALRDAAQGGTMRRGVREATSDSSYVLQQYNESLVAKLEERNIELAAQNEALLKAEQQLRLQATALETAANAITITDQRGDILWVNPAFTRLTGYAAEEVIGKNHRLLKSGKHDPAFYRDLWKAILSGQTWRGEFTNRRKDGNVFYGDQIITPVRSEAGAVTHFIGIMHDITGRKVAEESLRESERLLRLVIDLVPHFVFAKDAKSRHLFVNQACAEASGLTPEQMVGLSDLDLVGDRAQAEAFTRDDQEVIAGGQPKFIPEEPFTDRAGRTRFLQTIKIPFAAPGTGEPALLGVSVDITERKLAEQRLATHHAVTQALAESAPLVETAKKILQIICQNLRWDVGGLWTVDRTTKRLSCVEIWHPPSTEFKDFVTASRQAALAMGEGLPGRVWEAGQPTWVADLSLRPEPSRASLATRIGLKSAIAFPLKVGEQILGVIEFFSGQIRPPDGELLAMFATVGSQIGQFIERTRIEEQFRQAQKMEAFGQLAGGVAHDFNNILAVVMGYTHMLMSEETVNTEAHEQLKQIYAAGERAANLTRQLLTFSRKKEIEVSPLDLNKVIGNMTKMLRRVIGEDIKLQTNFAPNVPATEADEGMMEQVLMNLAVNARDAMPKGGGLTIGTEPVVVDAAFVQSNPEARGGEFVCLSVEDTGCGMTPEIKARIFEPFFTTKGVGQGTGLGLATVFGIVKQHQGWIEVESQVGAGSAFKVFLPAIPRSTVAPAQAIVATDVRGGHETILLVEDELPLRELTRLLLQRLGYRVLEAATGVEALSIWEEFKGQIDLLLTDMIMPEGLTGWELAKQLRAHQPALKVIYVSGYSLDSSGTSLGRRDASTFLQKPYDPRKLAQTIRLCLDQK